MESLRPSLISTVYGKNHSEFSISTFMIVYIKSYIGNLDIYQRTVVFLPLYCLEIIAVVYTLTGVSQVALMEKNPLPMKET